MAGRKSDFTLPTLDDLFSTQELRDDGFFACIFGALFDSWLGYPLLRTIFG